MMFFSSYPENHGPRFSDITIDSMKLVLTHDTALQLIRARRRLGYESEEPARIRTLNDCARSLRDVESFGLPSHVDNSKRIHILVARKEDRFSSRVHICHALTGSIPKGSFYLVGEHVYGATPELLFVQMANQLSEVELILLGLELCGTYTLREDGEMGFYNCPIATTKERLRSYVKRAHKARVRGARIAEHALRWVVDGSNSPMESALMLFFCLPVHRGGYGLPLPKMNPKKALSERASRMLNQETIRCDLHWLDKRVAVEYDSSQEHLDAKSAARDKLRANTLGYENTVVISVTPEMIAKPSEFEGVARQLFHALGKREPRDVHVLSKARVELRPQLFPWLVTKRFQ